MPSHGIHQGVSQGAGYRHARFPVTQALALRDFATTFTSIWPFQLAGNPVNPIAAGTIFPDVGPLGANLTLNGAGITEFVGAPFAGIGGLRTSDAGVQRLQDLGASHYNIGAADDYLGAAIVKWGITGGVQRGLWGKIEATPERYQVVRNVSNTIQFAAIDNTGTSYVAIILSTLHVNSYVVQAFVRRADTTLGLQSTHGLATVSILGAGQFSNGGAGNNNLWVGRTLVTLAGQVSFFWLGMVLAAPATNALLLQQQHDLWRGGIPIRGVL